MARNGGLSCCYSQRLGLQLTLLDAVLLGLAFGLLRSHALDALVKVVLGGCALLGVLASCFMCGHGQQIHHISRETFVWWAASTWCVSLMQGGAQSQVIIIGLVGNH